MTDLFSIETAILEIINDLKTTIDLSNIIAEKTSLFDHFTIHNISNARKNILSFRNDVEDTRFEARFFWLPHLSPGVYDISDLVFDKNEYTQKTTHDQYLISNNNINIKIRKNELHFKTLLQQVGNIYQYSKKKKLKFPVSGKIINTFLNMKKISDTAIFKTSEDLLLHLSHFPEIACLEVCKERYLRKLEEHTKIEFGVITFQGQRWKTICIESESLRNVLLLSLLVNQKEAEILSYEEFLRKYAIEK